MSHDHGARNVKERVLAELDSRIERLEKHRDDKRPAGNQYHELNQALSHVIGVPLLDELKDMRHFVEEL